MTVLLAEARGLDCACSKGLPVDSTNRQAERGRIEVHAIVEDRMAVCRGPQCHPGRWNSLSAAAFHCRRQGDKLKLSSACDGFNSSIHSQANSKSSAEQCLPCLKPQSNRGGGGSTAAADSKKLMRPCPSTSRLCMCQSTMQSPLFSHWHLLTAYSNPDRRLAGWSHSRALQNRHPPIFHS